MALDTVYQWHYVTWLFYIQSPFNVDRIWDEEPLCKINYLQNVLSALSILYVHRTRFTQPAPWYDVITPQAPRYFLMKFCVFLINQKLWDLRLLLTQGEERGLILFSRLSASATSTQNPETLWQLRVKVWHT